jgi:cytochrome c556
MDIRRAVVGFAAALLWPLAPQAADIRVPAGAGWTGVTQPKDVIAARQELMEHIELLMEPIDTLTVRPVQDAERVRVNAEVIGAMLLAVPHLFPPTTNRFDPKAAQPQTLALPPIWKEFDTFYKLAGIAAKAADAMAEAKGEPALRAASLALRGSGDACHARYLRRYEPPKTQESDYRFDFDAALRAK